MLKKILGISMLAILTVALSGCSFIGPKEYAKEDVEKIGRITIPRDSENINFYITEEEGKDVFARFIIPQDSTESFVESLGLDSQIISYFGQKNSIIDTKLEETWWQPVRLYEKKIINKKTTDFEWNIIMGKTVDDTSKEQITVYIYNYTR